LVCKTSKNFLINENDKKIALFQKYKIYNGDGSLSNKNASICEKKVIKVELGHHQSI
jgi:hypothetical protein